MLLFLAMWELEETKVHVDEMHMLRWICVVIRKDRIRNDYISKNLHVAPIELKSINAI